MSVTRVPARNYSENMGFETEVQTKTLWGWVLVVGEDLHVSTGSYGVRPIYEVGGSRGLSGIFTLRRLTRVVPLQTMNHEPSSKQADFCIVFKNVIVKNWTFLT